MTTAGNGSVMVKDAQGKLTIHTDNGNIEAFEIRGALSIESGNGDLQVEGTVTAVNLHTRRGNIAAQINPGSNMNCGWVVRTGYGEVDLRLPADFSADLGAIDTAMVARKIFREPNLLAVWVRKNDGRAERKAYNDAFKSANLFPAQSGLAELQSFYRDYSEWGTHPGLGAISLHTKIEARATGQDWKHTYLK
jgi:hypothetical protein